MSPPISPNTFFSPAKINLTLHISAPIPANASFPGYHRLDSLVAFAGNIGDVLHFTPADESELIIGGRFGKDLLADENNIILRALKLLEGHIKAPLGVQIMLEKNLPIASGIGGGSGNAAATLKGLNQVFSLGFDDETLMQLGLQLGADVPVCLRGLPIIMRNIGDEFAPAPIFPDLPIVLANPLIECSTPQIYAKFDELGVFDFSEFAFTPKLTIADFCAMINKAHNDLEAANFALYPTVAHLCAAMRGLMGAQLVRMSGSGGSVFAIFADMPAAQNAAETLRQIYNGQIWAEAGILAGNYE